MARLDAGMTFADRFQIERSLAEGGMGEVYVAHDRKTGQRVALKILNAMGCIDEEVRARFLAEARQTPSDVSDHVVRVYDTGDAEGRPWISMELLDGETLHARVTQRGPLSWGDARHVFEQLCHGLGAAHSRGIVHRDLKPENVFLQRPRSVRGGDDFVKVLDFGVAKAVDPRASRGNASIVVGTQGWWAPEQFRGGMISPATDVWSLGLLAYWCLTGLPFFDVGFPIESPRYIASARAMEQGVAERIAPDFDAWFSQCVAWDPSQRFRDANVAWRALDAVLTRASSGASPTQPVAPPSLATAPTMYASHAPAAPFATAPTVFAPQPHAPSAPYTPSLPAWGVTAPARAPTSSRAWVGAALALVGAACVGALLMLARTSPSSERVTTATSPPADTRAPAPPDRPFTENPELASWALRWYATATATEVIDPFSGAHVPPTGQITDYYAPNSGFHSTQNPSLDSIDRRWNDRRRWNRFTVHLATSTWLPQPPSTMPRRCAGGGEVMLLALDAEEEGASVVAARAGQSCVRVAGPYLLSVRREGGDWRVCNETWHLNRALRASCPGMF